MKWLKINEYQSLSETHPPLSRRPVPLPGVFKGHCPGFCKIAVDLKAVCGFFCVLPLCLTPKNLHIKVTLFFSQFHLFGFTTSNVNGCAVVCVFRFELLVFPQQRQQSGYRKQARVGLVVFPSNRRPPSIRFCSHFTIFTTTPRPPVTRGFFAPAFTLHCLIWNYSK